MSLIKYFILSSYVTQECIVREKLHKTLEILAVSIENIRMFIPSLHNFKFAIDSQKEWSR